jgi:GntR family transcriptional regulator
MTHEPVQPLKINRVPLPVQAQEYLLGLIDEGTYRPGEQLPSEHKLSATLGISRATLREALLNLEQEGVVIRRHGVGTFVSPGYQHRLESGLERLESVLELAARQGLRVECTALQVRSISADAEWVKKLQIAPGSPLTSVSRVIAVDGRPVAYMLDIVPASVLSPEDVDDAFTGSVLDLLRQKQGLPIAQAAADIIALNADTLLAERLKVPCGQAVLLLEEIVYDQEGTPVDHSRNYFVPDFFRFHIVRS